jgi:hypothetical protein
MRVPRNKIELMKFQKKLAKKIKLKKLMIIEIVEDIMSLHKNKWLMIDHLIL